MSKIDQTYSDTNSLEERKAKYQMYVTKHPTKIPIILERSPKCNLILLDRPEVLIEGTQTGTKLQQILKEKLSEQNKNCSVFLFFSKNNTVLFPLETQLKQIDKQYINEDDGFLYLTYNIQESLG